ncbi:MAG: N-acetylmuramic acid 6-phosphate etherase [Cryomorphaceae bacterium]|nr:MAG: N-acetylmuramic acid 6-phosphate etherase [Cryomorphaceae bacterium]
MSKKITEASSRYDNLEQMPVRALLENINREDHSVPMAVAQSINQIEAVVHEVVSRMKQGGRLFYLGAGTSGRLGIVDASECPPTFGVPHNWVIGLIAGGDAAIRKAVEFAEDDPLQGWKDLESHQVNDKDFVIGIAASGTTPYVVGALEQCNRRGIGTGCITCNPGSPLARTAAYPIEVEVGPEFVTGSTRMKSGTAQKLTLNMISTAVMIRLQRVKGNRMVDMQLSNQKLVERGTRMIAEQLGCSTHEAHRLLTKYGSVRKALEAQRED